MMYCLTPGETAWLTRMTDIGATHGMPAAIGHQFSELDRWALDLGVREAEWIKAHPEQRRK